ncbi:MAG: ferritin-like domain-containing protein [Aquihabitans sp.]
MPIEPTDEVNATTRRAFLTRSAAGGALVAAVAATGIAGGLGGGNAGAQTAGGAGALDNGSFAALAAPLELAAVQAYQAALNGTALDTSWQQAARTFQSHHLAVATRLATLLPVTTPPTPAPGPDAAVMAQFSPPTGADQTAVLTTLASLEEALAATHLSVIASLEDTSLAKTVAQILAVESQQAVALGRASGATVQSLTPAVAPTTGSLANTDPPLSITTTTAATTTN